MTGTQDKIGQMFSGKFPDASDVVVCRRLRSLRRVGIVCPGVIMRLGEREWLRVGVVAALAGGCAWDGPHSTLAPRSDFARAILDVYGLITWASIGIALVVAVALGWVLLKFRARPGQAM